MQKCANRSKEELRTVNIQTSQDCFKLMYSEMYGTMLCGKKYCSAETVRNVTATTK
jgi:hypothetical protein